jgi:hypothetical protein
MPLIRLLTSVVGPGPVSGDAGDEIRVDGPTASAWADGIRAELVRAEQPEHAVVNPAEKAARRVTRAPRRDTVRRNP